MNLKFYDFIFKFADLLSLLKNYPLAAITAFRTNFERSASLNLGFSSIE